MRQYISAAEFAKLAGVDKATITRWIKKGLIRGVERPTGAHAWRVPISAYGELFKKRT